MTHMAQARRARLLALMAALFVMYSLLLGAAARPQTGKAAHQPVEQSGVHTGIQRTEAAQSDSDDTARVLPLTQVVWMSDVPQQESVAGAAQTAAAAQDDAEAAAVDAAEKTMTTLPTPLPQGSADAGRVVAVPKDGQDIPDGLELIDTFIATAYCVTGTTATGTQTTIDRTLAVNPYVIPFGTHVWTFLDDGTLVGDFYAEDTGTNMLENPYVVDIYMGADTYSACMQWGAQHVTLYAQPEAMRVGIRPTEHLPEEK